MPTAGPNETPTLVSVFFPVGAGLCRTDGEDVLGKVWRDTRSDVKLLGFILDAAGKPKKGSSPSKSVFNGEPPLLIDDIPAFNGGRGSFVGED